MFDQLISLISNALQWVGSLLVENRKDIITIFIGSFCATYIGARAAFVFEKKEKLQEKLSAELHSYNTAITLTTEFFNKSFAMKKQLIEPMVQKFRQDHKKLLAFLKNRDEGNVPSGQTFFFEADLKKFPALSFSTETLQKKIIDAINLSPTTLTLILRLSDSYDELKGYLAERNFIVDQIQKSSLTDKEMVPIYYGLPTPKQNIINRSYPDTLEAIYQKNDDVLFFSYHLAKLLKLTAEARLKSKELPQPKVVKLDFTPAENSGLLPADNMYQDFIDSIAKETNRYK